MKTRRFFITCVAALAALALIVPSAGAQYFEGKTITILCGFSAGGGTDTAARLLAKHYGQYIPGNPNVIVKNMTGGGGMNVRNFMYERAKPDGLTLCFMPVSVQSQLLQEPGVRFDYGKFSVVGPLLGPPVVVYGRTDIVPGGLKESKDIVNAKDVKFAGHRPSSWLDLLTLPSLELLGVKYTYIPGYQGSPKMSAAVQRGEANVSATSLAGFRTIEPVLAQNNLGRALWYYPIKDSQGNFVPNPDAGDIPSFIDVYKQVKGEPSGWEWKAFAFWFDQPWSVLRNLYGPPGMERPVVEELRKAFYAMMESPDLKAEQMKIFGFTHKPISADEIEGALRNLAQTDPKIIQYWKDWVAEKSK